MSAVRRKHNGHWFDPDSMRFFRSRVGEVAYEAADGRRYFVSSERFMPSRGPAAPRNYTVRVQSTTGDIDTVGEFQGYATRRAADKEAQRLAKEGDSR